MFLAINEMKHSKLRYGLVVGVIFLIAYLVFFLTGLAYGLAQDSRAAVDKWDADSILLSKDSNSSLSMSMIPEQEIQEVDADEKAVLAQTFAVITNVDDKDLKDKIDVSFFGIESDQFLMPNIIEGKGFENSEEIVADKSLKDQYKIEIGDKIKLSATDRELTVVGFTDNARFNVSPVVYGSIGLYQLMRYGNSEVPRETMVNAIVVKGDVKNYPEDLLEKISIKKFINDLPGYSAQVMTFGLMIFFLIIIAAIVIGIFIYILTMQKISIFGVMKAQGISSFFIAKSVLAQTFLLALSGVILGLVGTILTSLVIPQAVPFQSNLFFYMIISFLVIVVAVIGSFSSVRTIVKIDPLKAIG